MLGAVGYGYDEAGNRTSMTDQYGSASYQYNSLSRLTSETRTFNVPANINNTTNRAFTGTYTLTYDYTAGGLVKSITDPWNAVVSYQYDKIGRLNEVDGANFANVSQYASGLTYRAWGAAKHLGCGNGLTLDATYNTRLQMTQYTVGNRTQNGAATVMQSNFNYYNDGRIKYSHDTVNALADTGYAYDSFGRLAEAYLGSEAYDFNYGTASGTPTGGYRRSYTYDGFSNLTRRTGRMWSEADSFPMYGGAIQFDSHNKNPNWQYDAAGNMTADDQRNYTLDAAGRVYAESDTDGNSMTQLFDGDGQRIGAIRRHRNFRGALVTTSSYVLHSSIVGSSVIVDLTPQGTKSEGYVYAGREVIAEQLPGLSGYSADAVQWVAHNPVTGSLTVTTSNQTSLYYRATNLDPMGVDVGFADPGPDYAPDAADGIVKLLTTGPDLRCTIDGAAADCGMAYRLLASARRSLHRSRRRNTTSTREDSSSFGRIVMGIADFCRKARTMRVAE